MVCFGSQLIVATTGSVARFRRHCRDYSRLMTPWYVTQTDRIVCHGTHHDNMFGAFAFCPRSGTSMFPPQTPRVNYSPGRVLRRCDLSYVIYLSVECRVSRLEPSRLKLGRLDDRDRLKQYSTAYATQMTYVIRTCPTPSMVYVQNFVS